MKTTTIFSGTVYAALVALLLVFASCKEQSSADREVEVLKARTSLEAARQERLAIPDSSHEYNQALREALRRSQERQARRASKSK